MKAVTFRIARLCLSVLVNNERSKDTEESSLLAPPALLGRNPPTSHICVW